MRRKISSNELTICAIIGLLVNNGNKVIDLSQFSGEVNVLAKDSDGVCEWVKVNKVYVKGTYNDLYVAFTDCMSGDCVEDKLSSSQILPKFYEDILNAVYGCINHFPTRILSYVDTSDNTKNPLCICDFNANGYLEEEENVIKEMTETIPYMDRDSAIKALNEMGHSSDGVGRFEEYEFFYEDCSVL